MNRLNRLKERKNDVNSTTDAKSIESFELPAQSYQLQTVNNQQIKVYGHLNKHFKM